MQILFEDNHLIAVNKIASEIVQGDKTGDISLTEKVKNYIKEKYNKPNNIFLGLVHRLDRPVSGAIVFAKTSKALSRMNELFRNSQVEKIYWAIVKNTPPKKNDLLLNYLLKNEQQNKSYIVEKSEDAKEAKLEYTVKAQKDNFYLLEVKLHSGRHHQIRCQLAAINCPIKGDLKYGAENPNLDGNISLHSRKIFFQHPVSKEQVCIIAPVPNEELWQDFENQISKQNIFLSFVYL
jgi:23S rRNA pseudouridine1911/1915/1917 synthase